MNSITQNWDKSLRSLAKALGPYPTQNARRLDKIATSKLGRSNCARMCGFAHNRPFIFNGVFQSQVSSAKWLFSYPLTDVPLQFFIINLMRPTDVLIGIESQTVDQRIRDKPSIVTQCSVGDVTQPAYPRTVAPAKFSGHNLVKPSGALCGIGSQSLCQAL